MWMNLAGKRQAEIERLIADGESRGKSIMTLENENERLRALIEDACNVFTHYDLPEHALHYRRAVTEQNATGMIEPTSDEGSELCQDPIPGHEQKTDNA